MIEELKDFAFISIKVTKTTKKQIVNYLTDDNYTVWRNSSIDRKQQRIQNYYDGLQDSSKIYIKYIMIFMSLNILTLGAFSVSILKSKKKEIKLLQSFGYSKLNSFIPSVSSVILPALLSFITAYILTPLLFNQLNKLPESDEYFYDNLKLLSHNLTSVLINIALFLIIIIIGLLFSSIQFIKYRKKLFTNTYSIQTIK
jgi:hypothetical protein